MFKETVATQYHQAKQQQIAEKLDVQQLQNQMPENVDTWETESVIYVPFKFSKVLVEERKFGCLLVKNLTEVD